jgi:hypothetical protein
MNAPKTVRRAFRGLVGLPTDEAPTPTAVPPPASTQAAPELQCDYRCVQGTPPWVCLCCRHIATDDDMTAAGVPASRVCSVQNIARENQAAAIKQSDKKSAERERRAAAGREKRKIKRDQLAAIKAALRTPVAVIISEADKKRQEEKLEARMSRRPRSRYQVAAILNKF